MELLAALFIRRLIARFSSIAGLGYQHRSPDTRLQYGSPHAVTSCLRLAGGNGDLLPQQLFNNVDLPTFGRPTIAINPHNFYRCSFQLQFFQRLFGGSRSALRRLEPVPTTGSLRPLTGSG